VQAGWINAGGVKTRGADLGLRGDGKFGDFKWSAGLDGTWTQHFQFAELAGQAYKEYVGNFYTRDLYLRWKHNATLTVARGDWSGTLSNNFASGYNDQVPNKGIGTPPPGFELHHLGPVDQVHRLQERLGDLRHPEPVRPRPAVHRAQRRRSRGRRLGSARGQSAWPFVLAVGEVQVLLICRFVCGPRPHGAGRFSLKPNACPA
jgi:hypothetical protein